VTIGQPKVKGELDKAIIRRYVKRNIQKLRYCYEKELIAKTKLKGTITATFVIGADGKVTSAKATGLKDGAAVEECYGRMIEMIAFPKPKTGEVTVTYPFTLKPN
jgi:flavin-dependent dehydrogenase